MITYVTGGARSGKSGYAEGLALQYNNPAYLATAVVTDDEMALRIQKHRSDRQGKGFTTFEEYLNIPTIIKRTDHGVYLLDCITVLITNLIFEKNCDLTKSTEDFVIQTIEEILSSAKGKELILVSNEVGLGLVPEYPLSRFFRDVAGRANQLIAQRAHSAYILISGIPLKLK